jgi:hypothetical protein
LFNRNALSANSIKEFGRDNANITSPIPEPVVIPFDYSASDVIVPRYDCDHDTHPSVTHSQLDFVSNRSRILPLRKKGMTLAIGQANANLGKEAFNRL